ncbi:hypothetical protein TNCV_1374411 [Trichonephila clavipes]|nr:hypothetical protein TNCV_1374411 [Trichonephila clavipes]
MQRDCALRIAGRGRLTSFSVEYKTGGVLTSGSKRCHLHEDQAQDTLDRPVVEKTATSFPLWKEQTGVSQINVLIVHFSIFKRSHYHASGTPLGHNELSGHCEGVSDCHLASSILARVWGGCGPRTLPLFSGVRAPYNRTL